MISVISATIDSSILATNLGILTQLLQNYKLQWCHLRHGFIFFKTSQISQWTITEDLWDHYTVSIFSHIFSFGSFKSCIQCTRSCQLMIRKMSFWIFSVIVFILFIVSTIVCVKINVLPFLLLKINGFYYLRNKL